MKHLLFLSTLAVGFIIGVHTHSVMKRSPNNQPSPGFCNSFNWGGASGLHYYICCNNCNEVRNVCNRVTYHSASSNNYCGSCGKDEGNGDLMGTFKCGGCSAQSSLKDECISKNPISKYKGFCWVFTDCFEENCRSRYKRSTDVPRTCFNLVCDPGETPENCPSDCCYKKNPAKCTWKSTCIPKCCGSSTCCGTSGAISKHLVVDHLTWTILLVSFLFTKTYL